LRVSINPTRHKLDRTIHCRPEILMTSDELLAHLESLGIVSTTSTHPPLRTVEDSKRLRGELPGGHVKNLFLRDKRGRHWLLTTLEDTRVDLKAMAQRLDAAKFSFASAAMLGELLGIEPGAVSPLAVINDADGKVTVVFDEAMLARDPLNVHPLRNDRTTTIATADLLKFLSACGHAPLVLRFGEAAPAASG
jgi:Ala-tRNA(Pro) deacylase